VVIDLIVKDTGDGYTADVPSINGCESWAHKEDDAINNAVELLKFYLNLPEDHEIKIDRARKSANKIVYKLIFNKEL
jgi:predicted RNase H-like HicB family nuclease